MLASRRGGEPIRDDAAYLLGIARKKLADEIQHARLRDTVPLAEALDPAGDAEAIAVRGIVLRGHAFDEALAAALARLTPVETRMLYLRYVDRLTNAEASGRLGLSPPRGSRIRNRAVDKLRIRARQVLEERLRTWTHRREGIASPEPPPSAAPPRPSESASMNT
jgi:RNA polymerase sigma factor (sigma-70 family)